MRVKDTILICVLCGLCIHYSVLRARVPTLACGRRPLYCSAKSSLVLISCNLQEYMVTGCTLHTSLSYSAYPDTTGILTAVSLLNAKMQI